MPCPSLALDRQLQDIDPPAHAVDSVDQPILIDVDIVHLNGVQARPWWGRWHVVAYLVGMEGVLRDVIDPHAHAEESPKDEIVGAERGRRRVVFMDVVGAEAGRALGEFFNLRHYQQGYSVLSLTLM